MANGSAHRGARPETTNDAIYDAVYDTVTIKMYITRTIALFESENAWLALHGV